MYIERSFFFAIFIVKKATLHGIFEDSFRFIRLREQIFAHLGNEIIIGRTNQLNKSENALLNIKVAGLTLFPPYYCFLYYSTRFGWFYFPQKNCCLCYDHVMPQAYSNHVNNLP